MSTRLSLFAAIGLGTIAALTGCKSDPNSPGIEYMPDMYRSPAVEAYVDYGQDPYYFPDSLVKAERNTQSARYAPEGTIPFAATEEKAMFNFPYPYANTPEDYERAGLEVHSPIPFTKENVEKGKVIFTKFCVHCHGESGQGDGTVPQRSHGNFPPPPAYDGSQLKALPEGKMFHTITYGKGMMGSHAGQLNKEERWTVVQYVKYLQRGGKMDAAPATADSTAAVPAAVPPAATPVATK